MAVSDTARADVLAAPAQASAPMVERLIVPLAVAVIALGLGVLAATVIFGADAMRVVIPRYVGMAPSTSVSFVLIGAAILALSDAGARLGSRAPRIALTAGLAVVAWAAADLVVLAVVDEGGLDNLLFGPMSAGEPVYMAHATAIGFAAAGACAAYLARRPRGPALAYVALATFGLVSAAIALTGYVFDAGALRDVLFFTAMARYTAAGLAAVFVAFLLLRADWGWLGVVLGAGQGSAAARRVLPTAILAPLLLTWIAMVATNLELVPAAFALNVMAVVVALLLAGLIIRSAGLENRHEMRLEATLGELRAALGERDVLLAEVYHRVKNNLQQVDAFLFMQAARVDAPEAKEALSAASGRVRALAAVHEMLLSSADRRVFNVDEFLTRLCERIADGFGAKARGVELRVIAAREAVSLDFAIPLGLLVNELVANALKHAFPDDRGGRIEARYSLTSDGGAIVEVADNGVGIAPDDAERLGGDRPGSRIIRSLAAQLRGELSATGGDGTTVTITISPSDRGATT